MEWRKRVSFPTRHRSINRPSQGLLNLLLTTHVLFQAYKLTLCPTICKKCTWFKGNCGFTTLVQSSLSGWVLSSNVNIFRVASMKRITICPQEIHRMEEEENNCLIISHPPLWPGYWAQNGQKPWCGYCHKIWLHKPKLILHKIGKDIKVKWWVLLR